MTFSNEIEKTKEDIAILQEKLKKLEELDRVKTPCEEAYKRLYGCYPMGEPFWIVFKKGYDASQKDYKVEEPKPETLYDLIGNWWDNVFVVHNACNNETSIDYLVNDIEKWLPDELIYDGEFDAYERGWNDAIRTTKQKLR
jgi:hypothetical protein